MTSRVELTHKDSKGIETKDYTSKSTPRENLQYIICYNILPTVAYRQNYLGINTDDPTANGQETLPNPALTISAYNNNKIVYLVSSEKTASIDLETGKQTGFIIDGGTWDEI